MGLYFGKNILNCHPVPKKYLQNSSQQLDGKRFWDYDVIIVGAAVHTIVDTAKGGDPNWRANIPTLVAANNWTKAAESYREQMETMIQVIDT